MQVYRVRCVLSKVNHVSEPGTQPTMFGFSVFLLSLPEITRAKGDAFIREWQCYMNRLNLT